MDQNSAGPRRPRWLIDRVPHVGERVSGRLIGRWAMVALAVLVPAALWGVATASAEASLGPHRAHYEVTLDQQVTVDLGPLGTLVIDSPLPVLGATVVVQEIPREVTALGDADTLEALGQDLESYVQFFSGPESTLEVAVRALLLDAVRRSIVAALVVALGILSVHALLGRERRGELAAQLRTHRGLVLGTTAVVLLVGTLTSSGPATQRTDDARQASRVFDGTPLEGARITGRLAGVIDTYGGYVVDAYRDNEDFYDRARTNVVAAWRARAESDAALESLRESMVFSGPASTPHAGRTAGPDSEPRGGSTDDGAETDHEQAADQDADGDRTEEGRPSVVMLVISDLHCNVGMARVIRAVAELSEAQIILNAGDTTVNGTAVESYCITAFADAVPPGARMVVADGNHDSAETSAQERAAGATVLDGDVVEVDGVRILGDSDPSATRIGSGTRLVSDETPREAAERLAEIACATDGGIDLLLVHNPAVGNPALDRGCAPAQVSGHLHRRLGPTQYGEGVRFVSSSTAGATQGQATLGPLNGIAELTVLRFDPDTRSIVDYRLVRVHPDTRTSVGFAVRWPSTSREPVVHLPPGAPR